MRTPEWAWRAAYLWQRAATMRTAGFTRADRRGFLAAYETTPCELSAAQWRLIGRYDRAAYARKRDRWYLRSAASAESHAEYLEQAS